MSWQVYVDQNLIGSQKVSKAAILGHKGGVWATSAGYNLSPEEQKAVIAAFNNTAATQVNGIRLAGQKFFTLRCDPERVYGKKGADGCVLVKTKQAILVTEYVAPTQAPEATPIVEGLADYLKNVGY
ncbi:profilin [Chiua virens]|nr:profilin [Chiua virens]